MSNQRVSYFAQTWKTLKSIPKIRQIVGFSLVIVCLSTCIATLVSVFNIYVALIVTYPLNSIVMGLILHYAAMIALEEPVEHEVFSWNKGLLYLKGGLCSLGASSGTAYIGGLVFSVVVASLFVFLGRVESALIASLLIVLMVVLTLISPVISTYVALKQRGARELKTSQLCSYLRRPKTGIVGIVSIQLLALSLIIALTSMYLHFYFEDAFSPLYFKQTHRLHCIFHKPIPEQVLVGRVVLQTIGWMLIATCFATVTGIFSLIIAILVVAHWFRQFNPRKWVISDEQHCYPIASYKDTYKEEGSAYMR